jgi:Flp pilus assembly protein TadG
MRIQRLARTGRRVGATTVEFMFVAFPLFLLLFGIFEYGRYLFVRHAAENAARDGARFAAVHTNGGTMAGEPVAVNTADVQGVVRTGMFNGRAYGSGLLGVERDITEYTCDVYSVTAAHLAASPPDLAPAGKPSWTAAGFQGKIVVRISGTYRPIIPRLVGMASSVDFTATAMATSEGN